MMYVVYVYVFSQIYVYHCISMFAVIKKNLHLPLMFQKAMFEVEDLSKKRKIKAAKAVTKTCTEKQRLFSFGTRVSSGLRLC